MDSGSEGEAVRRSNCLTDIVQNDEELVLGKSVSVGRLLQHGVETSTGTVLHHQDFVTGVGLTGGRRGGVNLTEHN